MPDEVGTETTRSDAPSVDDSLFGDAPAADDKPAAAVEGEGSIEQTEQDGQCSDDAGEQDAKGKAEEEPQGSDEAAESEAPQEAQESTAAGDEVASMDDLKLVVSIKGGRATIGAQRPSADPHIETFDDPDLSGLAEEVVAVTERAKARWEEAPKHPAYERPSPSAPRRNRRQQGAAQEATPETQEAETQQQTLGLF